MSSPSRPRTELTRRAALGWLGALPLAAGSARAAEPVLRFPELYAKVGVLGMEFSDKVEALAGKRVTMLGFMAPPLKAEANFFVLTETPMALCPFCSSDADWPANIVVVYLARTQTFVQPSRIIAVDGRLEMGSWTDPETGFLSLLRLREARYQVA
jgi:hypothetical protein